MSLEELVQKYRGRIDSTSAKKTELEKIIREIDNLTYTKSGEPISESDKLHILVELRKQAVYESTVHFAQDNSEFLELLNTTITALGGK